MSNTNLTASLYHPSELFETLCDSDLPANPYQVLQPEMRLLHHHGALLEQFLVFNILIFQLNDFVLYNLYVQSI